jgi:hypothetical protein
VRVLGCGGGEKAAKTLFFFFFFFFSFSVNIFQVHRQPFHKIQKKHVLSKTNDNLNIRKQNKKKMPFLMLPIAASTALSAALAARQSADGCRASALETARVAAELSRMGFGTGAPGETAANASATTAATVTHDPEQGPLSPEDSLLALARARRRARAVASRFATVAAWARARSQIPEALARGDIAAAAAGIATIDPVVSDDDDVGSDGGGGGRRGGGGAQGDVSDDAGDDDEGDDDDENDDDGDDDNDDDDDNGVDGNNDMGDGTGAIGDQRRNRVRRRRRRRRRLQRRRLLQQQQQQQQQQRGAASGDSSATDLGAWRGSLLALAAPKIKSLADTRADGDAERIADLARTLRGAGLARDVVDLYATAGFESMQRAAASGRAPRALDTAWLDAELAFARRAVPFDPAAACGARLERLVELATRQRAGPLLPLLPTTAASLPELLSLSGTVRRVQAHASSLGLPAAPIGNAWSVPAVSAVYQQLEAEALKIAVIGSGEPGEAANPGPAAPPAGGNGPAKHPPTQQNQQPQDPQIGQQNPAPRRVAPRWLVTISFLEATRGLAHALRAAPPVLAAAEERRSQLGAAERARDSAVAAGATRLGEALAR